MRLFLSLFFGAFLTSVSALAAVTFGAEFTFTNNTILEASKGQSHIVNNPAAVKAQKAFLQEVQKTCEGCTVAIEKNGYDVEVYKISYSDGWYFVIATDPAVVEVQTKPSTVAEYQKIQKRMQKDIFNAAAKSGIKPHLSAGGGHIHFDYSNATRGGDLKTLRNLLVDFANHPELAHGIWALDSYNAPSIAALPIDRKNAFKKLIADVDAGQVKTVPEFLELLRSTVYNYQIKNWMPLDKYQGVNVTRVGNAEWDISEQTIEIRHIRPQKSAAEFLAEIQVLEGRIDLNLTRREPLSLNLKYAGPHSNMTHEEMGTHINYVAEAGVDPADYIISMKESFPQRDYLSLIRAAPPVTVFCYKVMH